MSRPTTPPTPAAEIQGPAAWRSGGLAPGEWLHVLTAEEIAEVERAARALAARDLDLAAIAPGDFPLPTLAPRLAALLEAEVLGGRGFVVLRGLDPAALTRR